MGRKRDYTEREYQQIKKDNKKKLDKIFANPNYQEDLGKKYYGENGWHVTLYGNHPLRDEMRKENTKNAHKRLSGEDIPYKVRWNGRPINQYTKDGELVAKWDSALAWCKANNEPLHKAQTLVKAGRGFADTGYGFLWEFENEEDRIKLDR